MADSLTYCLPSAKYPSSGDSPAICTYGSDGDWFGVFGSQISGKGSSVTVPLYNKKYDRYPTGGTIPESDRVSALNNVSTSRIPPTVMVEFFTNDVCTGDPSFTGGGDFLKYYDEDLDIDAYGEVDLGDLSDQIRCMKMTNVETFSTFVDACQEGNVPQDICQQYASPNKNPNEGGNNNTGNNNNNNDGDLVPADERGYFYIYLFIGLFLIIMIVVIMLYVRNSQISSRKQLNRNTKQRTIDDNETREDTDVDLNDYRRNYPEASAPPLSE